MDAWDLQAEFPEQIGKGCVDSLPQSQQGCESQVPFHLASQTGCGEAPGACWSVPQHQGVRPEQTPLPPQQPQVLACRQPEYAYAGWLPQTAPGTPQPISGRSLLGGPTVAACNLPSDLPVRVLPQPAAAPRVPQGVVKQPPHTQPPPEAGALGQLTALPTADGRLAAPVSNMCLETYCQIHSLLTGGGSTVVQQLHALQCSSIRSQDIKQVLYMHGHAVGSKTKQDILDKMVGLPLCSMQRHIEAAKLPQASGECAMIDSNDLAALGLATPTASLLSALQRNELHESVAKPPCTDSKDASPQQNPGAEHCTADDSQLTQPADSHCEEVSTAAVASDAHYGRKRKAEAWLPEETVGDMRKQPTRTRSALDCAATCCPGSVVWATMGKKKWPALVLDADVVKADEEQLHARVQLFATGIKTTVKQAACFPFHSTDASVDDSALAHKAFAAAQMHIRGVCTEE